MKVSQRFLLPVLCLGLASLSANQSAPVTDIGKLPDPFSAGWILKDTNADGIADYIDGKIVVPAQASAAENAAAANIAARLAFGTTGLTPSLVVTAAEDSQSSARIWIGKAALPATLQAQAEQLMGQLGSDEGGAFTIGEGLAILGSTDAGLTTAANAFAARAPYIWKVPGEQFNGLSEELKRSAPQAEINIRGIVYSKEKAGVTKLLLASSTQITAEMLDTALKMPKFAAIHEIEVSGGGQPTKAVNSKPLASARVSTSSDGTPITDSEVNPKNAPSSAAAVPAAGPANSAESEGATPAPLDLATVYTSKGLFKGTPKMPLPSSLDGQLYVPAGPSGTAMANLAARMGLEATGLTLPLARPAGDATPKDVHTKAVVPAGSNLGREAQIKLEAEDPNHNSQAALAANEGELRIVDHAFGRQPALLVRGDDQGAATALQLLSDRVPNLWDTGKQYASLEELRYDLHRFFSLRSGAGQASASLYHLDKWASELGRASSGIRDVKAEVYVDLADEHFTEFVQRTLNERLPGVQVKVKTGSLHAGIKCCEADPALHFQQAGRTFHQDAPTFQEDFTLPWEGTRLLSVVKDAVHDLKKDRRVTLVARVSEGPEVRKKLRSQLTELLARRGINSSQMDVQVLCAYKQGYSWLMDEIAPKLHGKQVGRLKIEFAKNVDVTGLRTMYSPARWVQELYPVDEMLSKELAVPLKNIELSEFEPQTGGPTYRVHAYDSAGTELLGSDFSVISVMRPYNAVISRYEQVQVETGWVHLQAGEDVILDQRIKTDLEEFWDHYQDDTLSKVYKYVMSQAKGNLRPEFAPPFDTLRIDINMSEPDYSIGLDKERISSLEALQEDTFYSTENFVNMLVNLESGRPENYVGRIIPVVHASQDGKDGHVHIEFYGKSAANPVVRLSWTDAQGRHQEKERDLPVITGAMQPRLLSLRAKRDGDAFENLTWILPADYVEDRFEDWIKLQPEEQVERSIFSVEHAKGQVQWLSEMHEAGLYRGEVAYPHVHEMAMEFELPVPLSAKADSAPPRSIVKWNVPAPAAPRPLIENFTTAREQSPIVQWDEPISPDENASILARFAKYPGVTVYWMGRSYLGRDMWAADFTLPSPAKLRSWAKETTLKASILYSGRQHANEVSSTSHVNKLGELLATDPGTNALLKQVNVILHPIDNPDGAQMSIELAKITPDNLLHPGYHGSLAADVSIGQSEPDPVYPESRVRRLLLESWLPDGFLNPHGYPSHEWVQPFSEYTGWVQSREGANPGRAWWIPRGWFTSLNYIRDPEHPYSEKVTFEIRDRIVEAERSVPGLLDLENRMNDRYERFGQRWQPKDMTQPIVNGIRIYMSLKGMPAPRPGSEAQRSASATGGVSPEITWDSGYTEAPDETAHGDYLKLMASAGLAFDKAHLSYLANGKLRIRHIQREAGDKVTWQILRDRPNLPASELTSAGDKTAQQK